jgi:hypothetical protein
MYHVMRFYMLCHAQIFNGRHLSSYLIACYNLQCHNCVCKIQVRKVAETAERHDAGKGSS